MSVSNLTKQVVIAKNSKTVHTYEGQSTDYTENVQHLHRDFKLMVHKTPRNKGFKFCEISMNFS